MTQAKHVVIAGAGIVGVSSAIWLQRAGFDVTIVDREGPAAGTSFGNAGVLASAALVPVPVPGLWKKGLGMLLSKKAPLFMRWTYLPKLVPFLLKYMSFGTEKHVEYYATAMNTLLGDSVQQHQSLARGTEAEKYIRTTDYCFGYTTRADFDADAWGWGIRKRNGVEFDVITGKEFNEYDPLYGDQFETVVRIKNHGSISDPGAYVKALAKHFVEQGGKLVIANIEGVDGDGENATGLKTDKGLIAGDDVVLATGAWAKPHAESADQNLDLETERGYHIELVNPSAMPKTTVMVASRKFVISPMDGRIRCAGIVEFGGLKAEPSKAPADLLKDEFAALMPTITYDSVNEWMGHRPATPNSLPAIGLMGKYKNAYLGVGHQHLGLTGGPKTGRILSGLISGATPNIDLEPFSPRDYD